MSKYKFIKSEIQMVAELRHLWDNYELIKFLEGEDYIKQREDEICACKTSANKHMFILLTRFDWLLEQETK